ncbi:hypothetical protein D3C81_884700 [compost metagenome]
MSDLGQQIEGGQTSKRFVAGRRSGIDENSEKIFGSHRSGRLQSAPRKLLCASFY